MRWQSANRSAMHSAAAIAVSGMIATHVNAQIRSLEEIMVDSFLGNCVLNLPNLDKIRSASRVFGWKSISGDAAVMLGPIDRNAKYEGWLASDNGIHFLIGISTGSLGVQRVASCTVANPKLQQGVLLKRLQKVLELKFLNEESEAGQRYRSWTTMANGYSVLITFTSMQDASLPGGSLAAAVKLR